MLCSQAGDFPANSASLNEWKSMGTSKANVVGRGRGCDTAMEYPPIEGGRTTPSGIMVCKPEIRPDSPLGVNTDYYY